MKPQYLIVHHSLTRDGLVADWEAIRRFHKAPPPAGYGWSDIGYHYGIENVKGGIVLQVGRPEYMPGAHTKELFMNTKSLGICVVGNFDEAPPERAVVRFLVDFCRRKIAEHGIPLQSVLGHREVGAMAGFDWTKGQYKSCPGRYFHMDSFREMVAGAVLI